MDLTPIVHPAASQHHGHSLSHGHSQSRRIPWRALTRCESLFSTQRLLQPDPSPWSRWGREGWARFLPGRRGLFPVPQAGHVNIICFLNWLLLCRSSSQHVVFRASPADVTRATEQQCFSFSALHFPFYFRPNYQSLCTQDGTKVSPSRASIQASMFLYVLWFLNPALKPQPFNTKISLSDLQMFSSSYPISQKQTFCTQLQLFPGLWVRRLDIHHLNLLSTAHYQHLSMCQESATGNWQSLDLCRSRWQQDSQCVMGKIPSSSLFFFELSVFSPEMIMYLSTSPLRC